MGTIRVESTHPESQGPFVEIDDSQFDETVHKLYVESEQPEEPTVPSTPEEPTDPEAPVVESNDPVVEGDANKAPVIPQPWGKK